MSDNVVSFFELVADASVFEGAFKKAQASAIEFAAGFKATSASVESDANKMGIAIERGIATGSLGRSQANALIAQRLKFYGEGGGGGPAVSASAAGLGLVGLQAAAFGLIALTAAGMGAIAMTEHLVTSQAQFSQQILLNSQALGMNTTDLQAWEKIASVVGLDQTQMVTYFQRLAKNLVDGAPALKATGFTLKDLGITTTDTGQAILQLSDYFHSHGDAAEKAAIAQALFGRGGAELIPILNQGSAAVLQYKNQLEAMGVILNQTQLLQGAQAKAALTEFTTAFDVAKSQLVSGALPGFTVFFQTLSVIMQNNAGLWVSIGQTIGNVVMFITGLIAGFAGVSIKDMLAAPSQAGAAFEGLGSGAGGAAGAMDGAARSAAALTAALDAQIATLREQKRAQDDVFASQKQGLQDQLDALRDVTDHRRRQGEDIISYQRRVAEVELNDKIKAVDRQKTNYDRAVDDQIAALEKQKAAVKSAAGAMGADLTAGMNSGMVGLNKSLAAGMTEAQKKLLDTAHKMGEDIAGIFSDDKGKQKKAAERLGEILGKAIGDGIKNGLANWIGRQLVNAVTGGGSIAIGAGILQGVFQGMWDQINGHATGYFGATEHLARISEGNSPEVVLPLNNRSRSLALMEQSGVAALARGSAGGGGGAPTLVVNIGTVNGADPTEVARMMRALQDEARRRGFALSAGYG